MSRICERPGCPDPVAAIYGYSDEGGSLHVWLDSWSCDPADRPWPAGARGVVCERHGHLLTAPRGWELIDRREAIPRLFRPRPVLVHSQPEMSSKERTAPDGRTHRIDSSARQSSVDDSAARRRQRIADLPMPQLFSELHEDHASDLHNDQTRSRGGESNSSPNADGDRLPVADAHTDEPAIDDELSSLLDATGPLLRRAFAKTASNRSDASKELMRPTTSRVIDESA